MTKELCRCNGLGCVDCGGTGFIPHVEVKFVEVVPEKSWCEVPEIRYTNLSDKSVFVGVDKATGQSETQVYKLPLPDTHQPIKLDKKLLSQGDPTNPFYRMYKEYDQYTEQVEGLLDLEDPRLRKLYPLCRTIDASEFHRAELWGCAVFDRFGVRINRAIAKLNIITGEIWSLVLYSSVSLDECLLNNLIRTEVYPAPLKIQEPGHVTYEEYRTSLWDKQPDAERYEQDIEAYARYVLWKGNKRGTES